MLLNVVVSKAENGFILELYSMDQVSQQKDKKIEVFSTRDEILNRLAELF